MSKENNNNIDHFDEIIKLSKKINKLNSKKRIFFNGVISGIGRAFGATIIFTAIITILGFIIKTYQIEWVNELVQWLKLDRYLN